MSTMHHFLIIYNVTKQELVEAREFDKGETDKATDAYRDAERQHGGDESMEIVLVGADSLETIKRTHGHYFDQGTRTRSKYLTGV